MGGPGFFASDLLKLALAGLLLAVAIRWLASAISGALPILIPMAVIAAGFGLWRWRRSGRGGW